MALENENNGLGATMLVGPTSVPQYGYAYPPVYYGGGNSGIGNGDLSWLIVLFLFGMMGGGWGGFGGFGGSFGGYDFPWLLTGQQQISNHTSDGFRDAQIQNSISGVRDGVTALSNQLCDCCHNMTLAVNGAQNAITQQLYSNEIASLNRSFAEQTANTAGFTAVNSGIADTRYAVATEACANRTAAQQNTQSVLTAINNGIQSIKDQIYADKLEAKNDLIDQLRQEALYARGQASQVAQNAAIISGVYNEFARCPVNTVPVYGDQRIFSCNNGCGCGNAANF